MPNPVEKRVNSVDPKLPRSNSIKANSPRKNNNVLKLLGAFMLFGVLMAGMIAGAGFMGARAGQSEQKVRSEATVRAYLVEQYEKCIETLRKGNAVLAEAHCSEVVKLQPDNAAALSLVATARFAQTPTAAPPTATPRPIATDKAELLKLIQQAAASEDWDGIIAYTDQLNSAYPNSQTDDVLDARYLALTTRGLARLRKADGGEIEAGIYDLDQAAAIRPLSGALEGEKQAAVNYQTALSYFGADWETTIELLSKLRPGYRDVGEKLYEANLQAGEAYSTAQKFCQAEIFYTSAISLTGGSDAKLDAKRNEARTQCLLNPSGAISGTVRTSGTVLSVAGMSGKLIYTALDANTGTNQLHFFNSATNSMSLLGGSTQPVYQPNLGVAAVNGGGAIFGVNTNGGFSTLANVGGLWPSVSPDGARVAYVLYDNGNPYIYVARVDGATAPISLTKGTWPAWGPSGRIAFQGCPERCGIQLINPDAPSEVQQLTNSAGDINMQWSPNGNELVYASNYSGAWAIYRASLGNQFFQLTSGGDAGSPTFSPDGSRIAYAGYRDGGWAIYVMNADGSNTQKLIDLGPSYSSWQNDRMAWLP